MSNPSPGTVSNTQTIARNSFWYGLETVVGIVSTVATSIIVANVVGKTELAPYIFVGWLTNISVDAGATGLAITTQKYVAEFLNRGEPETAKAVYLYALKLQWLVALGMLALAMPLVLALGRPGYRLVSALLVINMAPRMISSIPSQANMGGERMRLNTGPSLVGGAVTVVSTLVGLWMGWRLTAVAGSFLAGCLLECTLKFRSVSQWLGPIAPSKLPAELRRRLIAYSSQGLVLMLLNIVVWDRSDILILGWRNSDIGQVTLFGIAFSYTEKLLTFPKTFSASLGATMMAQYGRGAERLREIMLDGARYGLLLAVPLLVGMACISGQFISTFYRREFQAMIPVLAAMSLLAIPKALNAAPTLFLQVVEKQSLLIWIGCICGAVDLGLDFLLTPSHGALGAAVANGVAQALACALLWAWVFRYRTRDLKLWAFGRIALAGAGMAGAVMLVRSFFPVHGIPGLLLSIGTGTVAWLVGLKLTGVIDQTDCDRLQQIGQRLPPQARSFFVRGLNLLSRGQVH